MAIDVVKRTAAEATRALEEGFQEIDKRRLPRFQSNPGRRLDRRERERLLEIVEWVEAAKSAQRLASHTTQEHRHREVQDILAKAREAEVAEESEDTLACIVALKDALATAIERAHDRQEEDYRDALVLIKWAAHNTYAEDMTQRELDGLARAAELLLADTVDQDTVWQVSCTLRDHDLDYIRPLASIEEEA